MVLIYFRYLGYVDDKTRKELLESIARDSENHGTVLVLGHWPPEVDSIADTLKEFKGIKVYKVSVPGSVTFHALHEAQRWIGFFGYPKVVYTDSYRFKDMIKTYYPSANVVLIATKSGTVIE